MRFLTGLAKVLLTVAAFVASIVINITIQVALATVVDGIWQGDNPHRTP